MVLQLKDNPLKKVIKEKKMAFGIYIESPSPAIIELAGLAGLDFVRLDWYHAPFETSMIENMIRAADCQGITPFVRLELDEQKICNVLEMGAMGIIVPDVSNAKKAKAVVDAAKFSPIGNRGMFSAARKSGYGSINGAAYKKWSNEQVMVGIQIESLEAIKNLDEILSVQGIDLVLSGRGDLANALNVPGQKNHPSVLAIEKNIFKTAKAKEIAISPQLDPFGDSFQEDIKYWQKQGAHIISLGIDLAIIKKSFEYIVDKTNQ